LAYDGERADVRALDQLEVILRHVADELEAWQGRAQKAAAQPPPPSNAPSAVVAAESRHRIADLEQENRQLRLRVEAARQRVGELLGRLTFLEDQAHPGKS